MGALSSITFSLLLLSVHPPSSKENHSACTLGPHVYRLTTCLIHAVVVHACSPVPTPHPAHARRRGLLSQVQILGLEREFVVMWKWESIVLYCSKWYYEIHYSHWPICNPRLPCTRLLYFHKPRPKTRRSRTWLNSPGWCHHLLYLTRWTSLTFTVGGPSLQTKIQG